MVAPNRLTLTLPAPSIWAKARTAKSQPPPWMKSNWDAPSSSASGD
jgi:hypothetical protein